MEALLHHTQGQLDHVRMVADERGLELAVGCWIASTGSDLACRGR
jgi:hypothetical protein